MLIDVLLQNRRARCQGSGFESTNGRLAALVYTPYALQELRKVKEVRKVALRWVLLIARLLELLNLPGLTWSSVVVHAALEVSYWCLGYSRMLRARSLCLWGQGICWNAHPFTNALTAPRDVPFCPDHDSCFRRLPFFLSLFLLHRLHATESLIDLPRAVPLVGVLESSPCTEVSAIMWSWAMDIWDAIPEYATQ